MASFNISWKEFPEYSKQLSNIINFNYPEFILTDEIEMLYKLLLLYFINDKRFEDLQPSFSLKKGLMLQGKVGNGKTTALKLFKIFSYNNTSKCINDIWTASKLWNYATSNESDNYKRDIYRWKNFVIDDIGIENREHYGNDVIGSLLFERYDIFEGTSGANKTHVTTNLTPNQLLDRYGERLYDRMKGMFNVIVLKGPSFRK